MVQLSDGMVAISDRCSGARNDPQPKKQLFSNGSQQIE
jgi:hypothetical protein